MPAWKMTQLNRTTILCVDSYVDGVPVGRFYHPNCEGACPFHSLSDLMLKLDQILDAAAFPQSFAAVRTFGPGSAVSELPFEQVESLEGELATFAIRVLFRQNASWQGSIHWLEGEREELFRSAMELIFLMDSVLRERVL